MRSPPRNESEARSGFASAAGPVERFKIPFRAGLGCGAGLPFEAPRPDTDVAIACALAWARFLAREDFMEMMNRRRYMRTFPAFSLSMQARSTSLTCAVTTWVHVGWYVLCLAHLLSQVCTA